jgi:hypothetical protein
MPLNEVDFSELGEAEATHSRDPRKINLGERLVSERKFLRSKNKERTV